MMNESKPPLIDLFCYLRDQGNLSLTIDQYFLLLNALENGFGVENEEQLKRVCRLLWIKGKDSRDSRLFEQYFDSYFEELRVKTKVQNTLDIPESEPEETPQKQTAKQTRNTQKNPSKDTPQTPENLPQFVPKALRTPLLTKERFDNNKKFKLSLTDFPISERKIKRSFSNLRQLIREGAKTEPDIEATIERVCQDGFFLEPVLRGGIVNRLEILWLIDVSNSMIPFEPILENLFKVTHQANFNKIDHYYFRNCITQYLYLDQFTTEPQLVRDILPKLHKQRTIVLIVSDGGAARRGFSESRFQLTADFVELWGHQVRRLLWLNPLPEERWSGTTAEAIANIINMVSLTPTGLKQGIKLLRRGGVSPPKTCP